MSTGRRSIAETPADPAASDARARRQPIRPLEGTDDEPFGNMAEAVAEAMCEIRIAFLERTPPRKMGRA